MIRYSSLLLFILLLCTCAQKNEIANGSVDTRPQGFEYFPDTLFEGLYFEMTLLELKSSLIAKNFLLVDSSESFIFFRNNDSTQIFANKGETFTEFKVYLKSHKALEQKDELMGLFSSFAYQESASKEYTIYYFNDIKRSFKLTFFHQPEYIRLNFEKRKHQ